MKLKRSVCIILFLLIAILVFTSGTLLKRTVDYQKENRKLILQNDSLQSVVINLNRDYSDTVKLRTPKKKPKRKR